MYYIKQGSNVPALVATPYEADGDLVSLLNVTKVLLYLRTKNGKAKVDGAECDIVDVGGVNKIRYEWEDEDLDTPGDYWAEFHIYYVGQTRPMIVPNSHYSEIKILPYLANQA